MVTLNSRYQLADENALRICGLNAFCEIHFTEVSDVLIIVDSESAQLLLHLVEQVGVDFFLQHGLMIEDLEVCLHIFCFIGKVQNIGVVLATAGTVQTAECLNGFYITQLLVHDHSVQKRLIEACLILFSNDQNVKVVVEFLLGLRLGDMTTIGTNIQAGFGIGFVVQRYFAGECHHGLNIIVSHFSGITLDLQEVQYCCRTRCGNHHHLTFAVDLSACGAAESLHNNF